MKELSEIKLVYVIAPVRETTIKYIGNLGWAIIIRAQTPTAEELREDAQAIYDSFFPARLAPFTDTLQ